MESFRPHGIRRVAEVWQDAHDMPWLVVARFAEVDGRVRCVGLELRSYVAQKESLAVDQGDWPRPRSSATRPTGRAVGA